MNNGIQRFFSVCKLRQVDITIDIIRIIEIVIFLLFWPLRKGYKKNNCRQRWWSTLHGYI